MAWVLESIESVESEGETIQVVSRSKRAVPSSGLLIQLCVPMNEHENRIVDMP